MQLIIIVWDDEGGKIQTLVNYDPHNACFFLAMLKDLGAEDKDGEIWKFARARVDLGTLSPRLDVFMEKDQED